MNLNEDNVEDLENDSVVTVQVTDNEEIQQETDTNTIEETVGQEPNAQDTETTNNENLNKNDKASVNYKKIIIASISIVVAIIFISTIFALVNISNENMIGNIQINQINIHSLSKEEALKKVTEEIDLRLASKEVSAEYGDVTATFIPSDIEFKLDVQHAIDTAYQMGRNSNIVANNYEIITLLIKGKEVDCEYEYNKEKLSKLISEIVLPEGFVDNSNYIEDNNLIISRGKAGIIIDEDAFAKELINCILTDNNNFDIKVKNKDVPELDIEEIYNEVFVEPKDAYYTKENGKFTIYPHVSGISFDKEAAKELLNEYKEEYVIVLDIKNPNVLTDQIGTEAFPDALSKYTTKYDSTSVNRSENLRIASQKINGKIIMPGETFSYNQVLGKRTIENGYKEAGVYVGGRVDTGVGGGICQISTTLYNAVLLANLEIVERRNHGMPVGYVPPSRDATVSYGSIDLKFKNNRTYPIKIIASSNSGIAKVEIFGVREETEYEVVLESYTTSSYAYTTKYEYVSSLATGVEKVVQKGANGYKSVAYRILKLNGEVVSKTLLSEDKYNPMNKIVQVGK